MTPGTAATKKKNVTFGDHVVDNQEKRPLKSGLPDDCPGKFPSPWGKTDGDREAAADKGRGRKKLTEALEQARDESRQRRGTAEGGENGRTGERGPPDENNCCEYWRHEYEVYRSNTQREVKKLVKKYKAAKDYAQSKDDEASEVRLHLQEAEAKADALEETVNILTAQIQEMEEKSRAHTQPPAQPQAEAETLVPAVRQTKERDRPRDLQALLERRGSKDRNASTTTVPTKDNDQLQRPSEPRSIPSRRTLNRADPVQRPSEPASTIQQLGRERQDQQAQPETTTATTQENTRATATGRTPAGIAARWAAVKDAPQRPSEPTPAPSKQESEANDPRRNHQPAVASNDKSAAASTRPLTSRQPAPPEPLNPPPGELFLPSDPAIYASSPPSKPPQHQQSTKPYPPHPTVEDAESSPPPTPPHHHPQPKRQDSGSGGALKALSPNARSGVTAEVQVGRDGKPIDAARLEAAKARIRSRGRDVS